MGAFKFQGQLALKVIPSDTIDIPYPTPYFTGQASATTANKLVMASADFINTTPVQPGDVVYNTTDSSCAIVTAVDSATTLSISADIMANTENFALHTPTTEPPVLFIGTAGDVVVEDVGGNTNTYANIGDARDFSYQVKKVKTATTASDILAIW